MDAKRSRYERLLSAFEKERNSLTVSVSIGKNQLLATYKLAWIICQKKHPFSAAEDFMEFARLADPSSPVFSTAPDSRRTITRRIEDIADYVLNAELLPSICLSPYFCLMIDDSLDKATHEQCILMVRFIDIANTEVVSKFLSIVRINGTSNAKTIFEALNQHTVKLGLPTDKLICITTDLLCRDVETVLQNSFLKSGIPWRSSNTVIHKEVLGVESCFERDSFICGRNCYKSSWILQIQ